MLKDNLSVTVSVSDPVVLASIDDSSGTGDVTLTADRGVSVQGVRAFQVLNRGTGALSIHSAADVTSTGAGSRHSALFARIFNASSTATLTVRVTGGRVTAQGDGAHGIDAAFTAAGATGTVDVTVAGGSVTATGAGSHGISLSSVAGVSNAATIQGMVTGGTGTGRGVHLANGGTVTVGRGGVLRAESGIAIQSAAGSLVVDVQEGGQIGRDEADVQRIQGSETAGDTTTITVSGVTLLEDNMPTGETVNVMYGVMNRGLQVLAESEAADAIDCGTRCWRWLFGEPVAMAAGSSRAFALEVLPQALLGLTRPARVGSPGDYRSAESDSWLDIAGHYGRLRPASATTHSSYEQQWLRVEGGIQALVPRWSTDASRTLVGVSGHWLDSSTNDITGVSAPGAEAELDATGAGVGVHLRWQNVRGFYLGAVGRGTWYDGRLEAEQMRPAIGGFGWSVSLAGGRSLPLARYPGVVLTPQLQWSWAEVQVDRLTVPFAASFDRGRSVRGRLGLGVERVGSWRQAVTRLQAAGSVEYEFAGETVVTTEPDRLRLSARSEQLWGVLSLGASVSGQGGGPLARLGAKAYAVSARLEGALGASGNYEATARAGLHLRF